MADDMTRGPFAPALRPFYQRLRAAGKPAEVALGAVARELPTTLDALVRDRSEWRKPTLAARA